MACHCMFLHRTNLAAKALKKTKWNWMKWMFLNGQISVLRCLGLEIIQATMELTKALRIIWDRYLLNHTGEKRSGAKSWYWLLKTLVLHQNKRKKIIDSRDAFFSLLTIRSALVAELINVGDCSVF